MMEAFFLLLLLFLPTQPAGQPAPASQVLAHVPPGASLVLAVDTASLAHGIEQSLDRLLASKLLQSTPELAQAAQQLRAGKQELLAKANTLGLNPMKDIRWATVAVGQLTGPEPLVLASLGGRIPDAALAAAAEDAGARLEGGLWALPAEGVPVVMASARDGAVLIGHRPWVELALSGKARNPRLQGLLGRFDRRAWLALALRPEAEELALLRAGADPALAPLLDSLEGAGLTLGYQSWSLEVLTSAKRLPAWQDLLLGLGRWASALRDASEGSLLLLRGYLSFLPPDSPLFAGLSPEEARTVASLMAHRDELFELLRGTLVGSPAVPRVRSEPGRGSALLIVQGQPAPVALLPALVGALAFLGARSGAEGSTPLEAPLMAPPEPVPANPSP